MRNVSFHLEAQANKKHFLETYRIVLDKTPVSPGQMEEVNFARNGLEHGEEPFGMSPRQSKEHEIRLPSFCGAFNSIAVEVRSKPDLSLVVGLEHFHLPCSVSCPTRGSARWMRNQAGLRLLMLAWFKVWPGQQGRGLPESLARNV